MDWIFNLIPIVLLIIFWWWVIKATKRSNEVQRKVDRSLELEQHQLDELREIKSLLKKLTEE